MIPIALFPDPVSSLNTSLPRMLHSSLIQAYPAELSSCWWNLLWDQFVKGHKPSYGKREMEGRSITVIGTPGIYSTTLTKEQLYEEMKRCISLSSPGPHVFLLVIRLETFTQEDRNTSSWIQENFGEEALSYTMVLFTGREKLTRKQWDDFERTETTKQCVWRRVLCPQQ